MLYLQNSKLLSPEDIPLIKSIVTKQSATKEKDAKEYAVKNIRVSAKEVQIDVFVSSDDSKAAQEAIALNFASSLQVDIGRLNNMINLSVGLTARLNEREIIQKIVASFEKERYWEAQETAEVIWNRTTNLEERDVVQGVILVGAALVHHQRNEDRVCLSMMRRALGKLEALDLVREDRRSFLSIDLEALRADVQAIIAENSVREIKLKYAPT